MLKAQLQTQHPDDSSSGNTATGALLTGAYVDVADLLRLRFSNMASKLRRHQANANQNGTRASKLRGRGVDFAEVRAYQPGDDIRTIDWRVTARKNAPHTKVFREEKERPTLVVVDQNPHHVLRQPGTPKIGLLPPRSVRLQHGMRWLKMTAWAVLL